MKKSILILPLILLFTLIACHKVDKTYYANGKLHEEKIYESNNHIIYKEYYENGNLKEEAEFINGNQNGLSIWYYENGSVDSKGEYKDNIQNGIFENYYKNGVLKSYAYYKNGKINGLLKSYFSNGKIQTESQYINNKQHGIFKEYYKNGQILMFAIFENDSTIYYQEYDSLGHKGKEFRYIKVIPEKSVYNIGDTFRAKVIICGPRNYKTSMIFTDLSPYVDKNSQSHKNVTQINYVASQPFKIILYNYTFNATALCDTSYSNTRINIEVTK